MKNCCTSPARLDNVWKSLVIRIRLIMSKLLGASHHKGAFPVGDSTLYSKAYYYWTRSMTLSTKKEFVAIVIVFYVAKYIHVHICTGTLNCYAVSKPTF